MDHTRDIIVFNKDEIRIIDVILGVLERLDRQNEIKTIENNRAALKELAGSISLYPSILEKHSLGSYSRSVESLVESLCQRRVPDMVLQIPTKAILGRGFSIAKINFLMMLKYIIDDVKELYEFKQQILNLISNNVFTLTAEEVYLSIIEDFTTPRHISSNAAFLLAHTWEYRLGYGIREFAPILTVLWRARRKLIPHFGTMLGFAELFTISENIEPAWFEFLEREALNDEEIYSLEEFMFGMTHEEIVSLRKKLEESGKHSVGRGEIEKILGLDFIPEIESTDPRELYRSFRNRKTHSRYRARARIIGPKKTLEEYLMVFLLSIPERAAGVCE